MRQQERPRPEYLEAARVGRWRLPEYGGHATRGLRRAKGFYAEGGLFIDDARAGDILVMPRPHRYTPVAPDSYACATSGGCACATCCRCVHMLLCSHACHIVL